MVHGVMDEARKQGLIGLPAVGWRREIPMDVFGCVALQSLRLPFFDEHQAHPLGGTPPVVGFVDVELAPDPLGAGRPRALAAVCTLFSRLQSRPAQPAPW